MYQAFSNYFMLKKYTFIRLVGGLGNQLFIYAFGLAYSKKNKTKKIKCPQKKRIECMEKDKICNPETGRCKKPVLHKTMKKVMKDLKTIKTNFLIQNSFLS